MRDNGVEEIVVHAPYIINLGSYKNHTYQLAVDFLQQEIHRTHALGVKHIVLHPGAYTDKDPEYGIQRIADGLNEVLGGTHETEVHIALETMAGKGTEMGRSFEEIASIIDKVVHNERLSICLDTCHIHDAGYDIVGDLDGVLEQFDKTIGLDRIGVVHINDSKNPIGSRKDRHTPIGSGWIGFDTINRVVHHELLAGRPFILETPWIGKDAKTQRPMYEAEIALLRGNVQERFGGEFWPRSRNCTLSLPSRSWTQGSMCSTFGMCSRPMPRPKGRSARADGTPLRPGNRRGCVSGLERRSGKSPADRLAGGQAGAG